MRKITASLAVVGFVMLQGALGAEYVTGYSGTTPGDGFQNNQQ